MNLIDLIAIIPFYFSLMLEGLEDMEIIGKAGKIIRLIRLRKIKVNIKITLAMFFKDFTDLTNFQNDSALYWITESGLHTSPSKEYIETDVSL